MRLLSVSAVQFVPSGTTVDTSEGAPTAGGRARNFEHPLRAHLQATHEVHVDICERRPKYSHLIAD